MKIKIYQIDHERDAQRLAYMNLDYSKDKIDCSSYNKVFEGDVSCSNLEDVLELFNLDPPDGFVGHSLSVSDVIELVKATNYESPGFYFCDSFGFKEIPFEAELTKEKSPFIKVVMIEPGKLARSTEINPTLENLQKAVGGLIQTYYPFEEMVCIVCNDEGKINGMELNRGIYGDDGKLQDIIAGTFFICDCSGERFESLSSEQIERFTKQFEKPERFYKMGDEITAVPYEPKIKDNFERA